MKTQEKLSTLWIVVMFNMLLADILSIFIELQKQNTLEIIGELIITMAIAALIINIPILMIYFSKSLQQKINRILNIVASVLTILFVIGGGSWFPHYIICAGIEVIVLLLILRTAWQWKTSRTI